jgi:hypothetical protein
MPIIGDETNFCHVVPVKLCRVLFEGVGKCCFRRVSGQLVGEDEAIALTNFPKLDGNRAPEHWPS